MAFVWSFRSPWSSTTAEFFVSAGGTIRFGSDLTGLAEDASCVTVELACGETLATRRLIACARSNADRIAAMSGLADGFAIVPFKGEYFRGDIAADHSGQMDTRKRQGRIGNGIDQVIDNIVFARVQPCRTYCRRCSRSFLTDRRSCIGMNCVLAGVKKAAD
ncbi:hypothetical protein AB9E06_22240 [Rhizobium leguminosarum]|uniref:hypothetical protein n=1 Tax=Rhizobium leguminosarum TaxID=384 RepID=UPI003F974786